LSRSRTRDNALVESRRRGLRPGSRDEVVTRSNQRVDSPLQECATLWRFNVLTTQAVGTGTNVDHAWTLVDDQHIEQHPTFPGCVIWTGGPAKLQVDFSGTVTRTTGAAIFANFLLGFGAKQSALPTAAEFMYVGVWQDNGLNRQTHFSFSGVQDVENDFYLTPMWGSLGGTFTLYMRTAMFTVTTVRRRTS
jgi:hypothetical protein